MLQNPLWGGILIEPEPTQFDKLQQLYEERYGIICVDCAIGKEEGSRTLYCGLQASTMDTVWRDRCIETHNTDYKAIEVLVKPLTQVLNTLRSPKISFLTIDCEGMDWEVLQSLDLKRFQPKFICMEGSGYTIPGYKEYTKTRGNTFYVRTD